MKDPISWFKNLYYDKKISLTQESRYAAEQYRRIVSSSPDPALQACVVSGLAALSAVENATTDILEKLGLQKTRTRTKIAFRKALPISLARIYSAAVIAFGPNGVELITIFPQGREIFGTCRDEQLNNHLRQLAASLLPFAEQLGQPPITLANGLASTWDTLFQAQGVAKDAKELTDTEIRALRKTLKDELYRTLLNLALVHFLDEEKGAYFCPVEYLQNRAAPAEAGPATITSAVLSADRQKVKITMTADDAEGFILKRRVFGQADYVEVATNIPANADGPTDFEDVLPGPGQYEYVAVAWHGHWLGEPSDPFAVDAS